GEVAPQDLDAVQRLGEMVEVPRERVRHRLRFVVIVETGAIAPARIAAQLDEPGAELETEEEPAEEPDEYRGHRGRGRTEERGEKACLEQQRPPSEPVEDLPNGDDRQVQRPQHEPDGDGERRRPAI